MDWINKHKTVEMHSFTKSRFYIPKPHIESLVGAEVCLIESLLFSKQLE